MFANGCFNIDGKSIQYLMLAAADLSHQSTNATSYINLSSDSETIKREGYISEILIKIDSAFTTILSK